jgi:release factor glutamine methyltransferase
MPTNQTSGQLLRHIVTQLESYWGPTEAKAIAFELLQQLYGLSKTDVLASKPLSQTIAIQPLITRLQAMEPVQYVLGRAYFCGQPYTVNQHTLIPRPETEELVALVLQYAQSTSHHPSILDIGTGSGCIAIALALALPLAQVTGCDVSAPALHTASHNAQQLGAKVHFKHTDILQPNPTSPQYNIIVSNPPYITHTEAQLMLPHVLHYEPYTALFVPDSQPQLFYIAIAAYAQQNLTHTGALFLEVNENHAQQTATVLQQHGFGQVSIVPDIHGKSRMVWGIKT